MRKQCLKIKLALIADGTIVKMRTAFVKSWVENEIYKNESNLNNVVFYYTTKTVNHYIFIQCEHLVNINKVITEIKESIAYQENIIKTTKNKYPLL